MLNKKHSFIDDFLNNYFEFLKDYDNLDYNYTAKQREDKVEFIPETEQEKVIIEDILKNISSDKFHILYGFYTFLDEESNKITHLYNQFKEEKFPTEKSSQVNKFIPVPISYEGLDKSFETIFDKFHENETQIFWNLPDAYRVNNWIFGGENYLHSFYKNTITQELNSKSAYNIILSEEILFFLYGKYYFENEPEEKISELLCLGKNYTSTTQITPNLKQLIKFACSVEAKLCKKELNTHLGLDIWLWNKEETEKSEFKNREIIEKFIDDKLVLEDVKGFVSEIHSYICEIIDELIKQIDDTIKLLGNEKFKTDYELFFYNNGVLNKARLWQKIARFNFDISEQLIKEDETKPFHDIIIFPILKSSTGTFESNTFFYKNCIENNKSVKIEVPFVMTCYITTLYGLDKSLLDEDKESLEGFNITMEVCKNFAKPIVDELFYAKLINARIKPAATRAAISQVMARNTSHNIGAHVMNNLIDGKKLKNINVSNFDKYQSPNITLSDDDSEIFSQIAFFNNYVRCRMDYLADITFGTPLMQTNKFATELFKEFDKVRLLLEHITGLSNFKYKISFKINGNPLSNDNDLLVAIPNDILGMQAFYNILENIIRNTAKHAKVKPPLTEFTVNFVDTAECDDNQEQINVLNDLIAVEVYDNIPIVGEGAILEEEENEVYKKFTGSEIIQFPDKITELVFKQNNKINADILIEDGKKLRTSSLGVIEMDASAAYLRKRDVSLINHEYYNIEHNDCWSCNAADNKRFDGKPKGTNCRNFLKAFKANINDGKQALGYRFFLLRPQVVLVITEDTIDKKEELKKQGIWIKTTDEFKKDLTKGGVFSHDFVVFNKENKNIEEICMDYKTALPLRILKVDTDRLNTLFEETIKKEQKEWLNDFEEFCWKEWDKDVLKLEFPFESFYPLKNKKYSNNCDHDNGYMDGANSGEYFYYDALSSQGQSKLPNFNGNILDYSVEFESTFVVKTKVGESIYSRILVFDERIQENTKETYLEIPISKLYEMTGVVVPDIKTINLSAQTLDKSLIFKEIRKYIAFDIDKYCEGFERKDSTDNLNADFDFILIHYSILERIFDSSKNKINNFLIELSNAINVVITSGRGEPEDLPIQVRFINLSTVVHSLVETRSKYFTNYIMHASRKSSKSK